MSFVLNDSQQITFDDACSTLTDREMKFLRRSWAHQFSECVFPKINEERFSVLYSDNPASRPQTPVNFVFGALLLKEMRGLTDDELLESILFDIRYQYALHTTSMKEQPISDRTFSRFRAKCLEYESKTGIDLIKDEIRDLSGELALMMNIDGTTKRMDSMMIASNIKTLSRLELFYTCLSNLICELKENDTELPEELKHYAEANDRNKVVYHNRSESTEDRIEQILKDCKTVLELCEEAYDSNNYRLLKRVLNEQTLKQEDDSYKLRTKEDGGMDGNILQNPADPDATFRTKAGKAHRGYSANIVESVGENGSIVTGYDLEPNTHSDSSFAKEVIEEMGKQEEKTTLVADGAYASAENDALAKENNIDLVTTNMTGRKANDIHADFVFSEDGKSIIKCPNGHAPKSCSFNPKSGRCTVSFHKHTCEKCPFFETCNPKVYTRTTRMSLSANTKRRAEQQRFRSTEEFSKLTKLRNGVESIPSYLRRAYNVDHMPVRGLKRCCQMFGFKIGASNIVKFCKYKWSLCFDTKIQAEG